MDIEIRFRCAGCGKTFHSPRTETLVGNGLPGCSVECLEKVNALPAPEPAPTRHQFRNAGNT